MTISRAAFFCSLLDPSHVSIDKTTAVVGKDMVGCLTCNLVIEIFEPAVGLCLDWTAPWFRSTSYVSRPPSF